MKKINLSLIIIFAFIFIKCTVNNDNILIDGSIVPNETVKICNQVWMTKNLDVDHYRNGDSITEVRDSILWGNLTTGAWCYYNNDPAMGAIYGKLYNWFAVNDPRGLAPEGWHIPSEEEWMELENCLGGSDIAGGKMKAICTNYWQSPNEGATNESGFYALPGGYRSYYDNGMFYEVGLDGHWWSSTEASTYTAWYWEVTYRDATIGRFDLNKVNGFSVRCIKD